MQLSTVWNVPWQLGFAQLHAQVTTAYGLIYCQQWATFGATTKVHQVVSHIAVTVIAFDATCFAWSYAVLLPLPSTHLARQSLLGGQDHSAQQAS